MFNKWHFLIKFICIDNGIAVEKNLKEEYLKPGFESEIIKEFEKQKKQYFDTDLDGE